MIGALVAVVVSMLDPITAGFGVLSGWFATRRPALAAGIGAVGVAALVALAVFRTGSHPQDNGFPYLLAQIAALALWALIVGTVTKPRQKVR